MMSVESTKTDGIAEVLIKKYRNGSLSVCHDFVAVESPLQIEIMSKPISITMRTPGDDIALALGFLFTEGLIQDFNQVARTIQVDENTVNIILEDHITLPSTAYDRHFYTTSSCGVCGKSSVDAIHVQSKYSATNIEISVRENTLYSLQEKLMAVQHTFEKTGGIHASALFDIEGKYMYHCEDVGRHNALDKLIGHVLMAGKFPLENHLILLSGRASFELIQKASIAGAKVVVAVGAPSSLAITLAESRNITLIGFVKKTGFNIYSHAYRIQ